MSASDPAVPWRITPDGLLVAMRLTPRGGRDALGSVETLSDGRAVLTAKVRAVPADGEANQALVKLVAKALGVSASRVSIRQGATSRIKMVLVEGEGTALERSILAAMGR
ncbi:DUF167 family protein [Labrys sp. KNU-23]|uniref:DUF167 family protein n=1 Tax=Labrys sp. KNU-23 TaxID=2789216 RepID=UPI001FEE1352|nr:DUF167 family protein [Labrys sp. KNU-23]